MPEGFYIGQFEVRFYGIILMLGAVAGYSARPTAVLSDRLTAVSHFLDPSWTWRG